MVDRNEIWKPIIKYDGLYEASNKGRIRRSGKPTRIKNHPYNKIRVYKKSIKKIFLNSAGYYRVNISTGSYDRHVLVHRLIAEAFIPNPLNKKTVNHKNFNRKDNRVENLEWMTNSEQSYHAYRSNRRNKS